MVKTIVIKFHRRNWLIYSFNFLFLIFRYACIIIKQRWMKKDWFGKISYKHLLSMLFTKRVHFVIINLLICIYFLTWNVKMLVSVMVCPLMVVINLISSMDSMQYLRINDSENIYRKKKGHNSYPVRVAIWTPTNDDNRISLPFQACINILNNLNS